MNTRGSAPRRARALLIGALFLFAAPAAHAGPQARARAALAAGMKAFKAGRYERALGAFRKAEKHGALIGELDRIRWNIARSLEELGRHDEMLVALDRCLEVATTPVKRTRVQTRIKAIEGRLFATVKVRCAAKNTQVRLDEKAAIPCPTVLRRVRPGEHRVSAAIGAHPYRPQSLKLQAGQRVEIRFEAPGSLQVTGPRGARVAMGGAEIGRAPLTIDALPPGYYALTIDGDARRVPVRPGAATRVARDRMLTLPPAADDDAGGGWTRWRPWVASGVSVGLLATATVYGLSAKDEWDKAHDLAARQRAADPADKPGLRARALDAADATQSAQLIGGLSLAGGLAAGALAWWWFQSPPQIAISPTGIGVHVTF